MEQDHFQFGAEFGAWKTLKNAKFEAAQRHDNQCYVGTLWRSFLLGDRGKLGK
jgi:hypothetical protein